MEGGGGILPRLVGTTADSYQGGIACTVAREASGVNNEGEGCLSPVLIDRTKSLFDGTSNYFKNAQWYLIHSNNVNMLTPGIGHLTGLQSSAPQLTTSCVPSYYHPISYHQKLVLPGG